MLSPAFFKNANAINLVTKRNFIMTTNFRAIATCLLSYICFELMSVHVRLLSSNYSPQELSVYRNVIGVLPAIFYMWYSKELSLKISDYKIEKWKLGILRGLIIAVAQLCFYTALANLELATVSALGLVSALFIVLLAIFLYKEKVGFWRWTAVVVGFLGAVMIMKPGTDIFSWYSILPICAAFCYASSIVTLRSFKSSVSSAILFLYSATSAAFGAMSAAVPVWLSSASSKSPAWVGSVSRAPTEIRSDGVEGYVSMLLSTTAQAELGFVKDMRNG